MDRNKVAREKAQQPKMTACIWNGCPEPGPRKTQVQAFKIVDKKPQIDKGKMVELNLCNYHAMLASSGALGAVPTEKADEVKLFGPFEMIHAAEMVFQAMIYTRRFDAIISARNAQEARIKEKHKDLFK